LSFVSFVSYRTACCGFFQQEKSDGFGRERTRDLGYQRPAPFDPRTVQPVVSRYTDWGTRPIYIHITNFVLENTRPVDTGFWCTKWHWDRLSFKYLDFSPVSITFILKVMLSEGQLGKDRNPCNKNWYVEKGNTIFMLQSVLKRSVSEWQVLSLLGVILFWRRI
jgi:hypothetical protein